MKVRAIRKGYYNHKRRYEGDVFNLFDEKDFSSSWMKEYSGKKAAAVEPVYEDPVVEDDFEEEDDEEVI